MTHLAVCKRHGVVFYSFIVVKIPLNWDHVKEWDEVIRLFVCTICRFLASQCVQESCLGNSPHVAGDVQLPSASHSTSLQSDPALSFTLACCRATYKPESASFVVIYSWFLTNSQGAVKAGVGGIVKCYIVDMIWRYSLVSSWRFQAVLKCRHNLTAEGPVDFYTFFGRFVRIICMKKKKRTGN